MPPFNAWTWLSALATLAIFTYLYRDNPVYKVAEYLFVGIAAGYYLAIQFNNVLRPNLLDPLMSGPGHAMSTGNWLWLFVPLVLSFMLFMRFVTPVAWLSRWPIGLMVGTFSGLAIIGAAQGDLIGQIQANLLPLVAPDAVHHFQAAPGGDAKIIAFLWVLANLLLIVGLLTTLVFFFFSTPHRGAVGAVARVGIYFLMLSFGASFGFTVMSRISLLLERLIFLYHDWLGIIRI